MAQKRRTAGDGKIKASDACSAPSGAKVLSARWVRTMFQRRWAAPREVRVPEERKSFNAIMRGVAVRACLRRARAQAREHGARRQQ